MRFLVKLLCLGFVLLPLLVASSVSAQQVDTALLRVTVTDPSGAVVPNASVTMINEANKVEQTRSTDERGVAIFGYLQPAAYTTKVVVEGFKTEQREHIVLQVGQESDLTIKLEVGAKTTTVVVTTETPLMNTVSPELGTTVAGNYILDMPLFDRNPNALVFLSPGVTSENGGSVGTLGGLNFSANGQRALTAEFRLDGAVASVPEGGEGGVNNVTFKPTVEGIQEFKLLDNGYSAQYGSNGGTVISMITKSGSNDFHGSAYYFTRRPWLDANNWFGNAAGDSRPSYKREEWGGSVGGPIIKKKMFFFVDAERDQYAQPNLITAYTPTALERTGDFSQSYGPGGCVGGAGACDPTQPFAIYDPLSGDPATGIRSTQFSSGGVLNKIPANRINTLASSLINLYPLPNQTLSTADLQNGVPNYVANLPPTEPAWQLDTKVDYYFSQSNWITGRYYMRRDTTNQPSPFLANDSNSFKSEGLTLVDNWALSPSTLWVNRFAVTRYYNPQNITVPLDPLSLAGATLTDQDGIAYNSWAGLVHNPWYYSSAALPTVFPTLGFDDGYQGLADNGCCSLTKEVDEQWSWSSMVTKTWGGHSVTFGGERRIFLNNFIQAYTAGGFSFGNSTSVDATNSNQYSGDGNGLASLLVNWPDSGYTVLTEQPQVANRSMGTDFFVQDDWKATRKLTINIGLRYQWDTPYTERYNRSQFDCLTCDSGIFVPALGAWPGGELYGTTILARPGFRHSDTSMNDVGPRLGFAYALNDKTVIRGAAGVYYGLAFATNWQYGGAAWQGSAPFHSTVGDTGTGPLHSSLTNPFEDGFTIPQEGRYGPYTLYGFDDYNHAGLKARNGEIYQWNGGIQHQFPGNMMIEVDYSANRSTHLPWDKSLRSQNFVSTTDRVKCDPAAPTVCGTNYLNEQVPNPFQYLFTQVPGMPAPLFNSTADPSILTSNYVNPTIARLYLLRQHPQFGAFYDFTPFAATSRYNSLQVRFDKRYSHGLSFTGNYTYSHMTSTSDEGANAGIGGSASASVQDKNNLAAEQSISANDTPHRFVIASTYELPIGRGKFVGRDMSRLLDAAIGGWKVSPFFTYQSGQPLAIYMRSNKISGGSQRPNLIGNPCSGLTPHEALQGPGVPTAIGSYFNSASFTNPGDERTGSEPRFEGACRSDSIKNVDLSVAKIFKIREGMQFELHGDFFNVLNHPYFGTPGRSFGSGSFGMFTSSSNERHGQLGVRFEF